MYILFARMRHILFWGIYVVNGLGYFTIDILLVGEDCSVHICGPPTPEHCCKTVLTPRGRRFWQQHLDVFTASIVFGGVGRVVLFSYYKSILLCILLCVILTVSPCSFFYLLIAFAQIHSPSSTPSCSNNIVGGANTPINILLPAQDIHRPICGRVVLFYLCSGTAPTCAAH